MFRIYKQLTGPLGLEQKAKFSNLLIRLFRRKTLYREARQFLRQPYLPTTSIRVIDHVVLIQIN